ncbi:hypothetical protein NPIL_521151 [Nephila pilipes]|uniref:Uncharacterized protein n=1 Tax=Nephila pilipes TaxID=299642 RepID=A0A8X6TI71_NEPPI|nr:hypothetical protein NPIL_521151 [Nephila pilipes]
MKNVDFGEFQFGVKSSQHVRRSEVVSFCDALRELTGSFHFWPMALKFQTVWILPFVLPNSSNRNFVDCPQVLGE